MSGEVKPPPPPPPRRRGCRGRAAAQRQMSYPSNGEGGGMAVECFCLATMRTVGGKGGHHTNNTTAPLPQQQCSNATVVQRTVQKLPYALRRRSSRATSTFLFPLPSQFSSVQRDASSSLHLPSPPHFPNIITAHRR